MVEETFWQAWRTASRYDSGAAAGSTWLLNDRPQPRVGPAPGAPALGRLDRLARGTTSAVVGEDCRDECGDPRRTVRKAPSARPTVAAALDGSPLSNAGRWKWPSSAACRTPRSQSNGRAARHVKTRIRLAMQKLRQRLAPLREEGP